MRLSDAFIDKSESENSLELCVKLIDVRYQSHHKILYRDQQQRKEKKEKEEENLSLLGEYSYFISKVEEYKKKDNHLEDAIKNEAILTALQKKLGIKEKQADEYLRKFYDKTL